MDTIETTTKKYITSLLTSTPLAVTMCQLSKDYKNTIGEPIPYQKLGYNSLEHFLRSIGDTVQVKGVGPTAQVIPVVSEKSAHVNNLVAKQRIPRPRKRQYFPMKRMTYIRSNTISSNPTSAQPIRKIHYPTVSNSSMTSKSSSQSSNSFEYSRNNNLTQINTVEIKNTNLSVNTSQLYPDNNTSLNKITEVVEEHKHVEKKIDDSRKLDDRPKLERKLKLEEKPAKIADTSSKKCTNVRNILKKVSSDKNKSLYEQENKVPYYVRNNLINLIGQCPEGIWCAEVPDRYRKMFRKELNYQELGYRSLIDLCASLPSIFHYVRPSTEDYKLYDRSRPLPDCAEKKFTVASYSVNKQGFWNAEPGGALPNIDWADVSTFLPEDIFKPGEEIPRTFISTNIQENDNIDVVVGEIYDLSKFWVYLQDSPLDQLMDDLQDFYRDHALAYLIPHHLIRAGQYCVQVIFGEYHRALIVDDMPEVEDTIRVIFIDYGTMAKVSIQGLCFLHLQFASIPAQAIRCRLANIVPLEEGLPWSREAAKAFRKLVTYRDTSAKICSINWEDQFLEVYLADVTDENNVFYINDKLVEEGFAQYPHQERPQPIVDPVYTPIVKFIHLFPTFLELEHGLAPSTAEMEVFHECNIPINFCYPQYFYLDYSKEEQIIKAAEDFHERHSLKVKRRMTTRFYDLERLKPQELDLSIFGELESEISAFLNRPPHYESSRNSDEDFVDAEENDAGAEDGCNDVDVLTEQLKTLSNREKQTVDVLKRDILVTEDIMKDINLICKIDSSASAEDEYSAAFEGSGGKLWIINESRESVESLDSTVIPRENQDKTDRNLSDDCTVLFEHPLSMLTFDKDFFTDDELSSNSPKSEHHPNAQDEPIYELTTLDVRLRSPNLDCYLPSDNQIESQTSDDVSKFDLPNGSTENSSHDPQSDENPVNSLYNQKKINTNPFLNDLNDTTDFKSCLSSGTLTLNPNNPFLTYISNKSDDNSDGSQTSSTSTVYESPVVQVKTMHSWSHFEDMSPETLSMLGRSLSTRSTSSNSIMAIENTNNCTRSLSTRSTSSNSIMAIENTNNCTTSTQTINEQVRAPQPNPAYHPQPVAFGYAHWSLGYANSYHGVRPSYPCESVYGPAYRPSPPPGLGPPPGFPPLVSFPPRLPLYHPGGNFTPPTDPPMNVYGQQPRPPHPMMTYGPPSRSATSMYGQQQYYGARLPPPQLQPAVGSTHASVSSVSSVESDNGDFYERYNELIKKKIEPGDQ